MERKRVRRKETKQKKTYIAKKQIFFNKIVEIKQRFYFQHQFQKFTLWFRIFSSKMMKSQPVSVIVLFTTWSLCRCGFRVLQRIEKEKQKLARTQRKPCLFSLQQNRESFRMLYFFVLNYFFFIRRRPNGN